MDYADGKNGRCPCGKTTEGDNFGLWVTEWDNCGLWELQEFLLLFSVCYTAHQHLGMADSKVALIPTGSLRSAQEISADIESYRRVVSPQFSFLNNDRSLVRDSIITTRFDKARSQRQE